MNISRRSAIGALAALATAGLLAAGAGAAIAANNSSNNQWGAMMGGSRTGVGMMGGTGNGYGLSIMGGTSNGYGLGMMGGPNGTSMMDPVADYLGLSTTDLQAQLRSGSSLADIAASQGKSVSGLKDVILRAMQQYLDGTSLTALQKSRMVEHMRASVTSMLDLRHATGASGTSGFRGMMGGNWGNSY